MNPLTFVSPPISSCSLEDHISINSSKSDPSLLSSSAPSSHTLNKTPKKIPENLDKFPDRGVSLSPLLLSSFSPNLFISNDALDLGNIGSLKKTPLQNSSPGNLGTIPEQASVSPFGLYTVKPLKKHITHSSSHSSIPNHGFNLISQNLGSLSDSESDTYFPHLTRSCSAKNLKNEGNSRTKVTRKNSSEFKQNPHKSRFSTKLKRNNRNFSSQKVFENIKNFNELFEPNKKNSRDRSSSLSYISNSRSSSASSFSSFETSSRNVSKLPSFSKFCGKSREDMNLFSSLNEVIKTKSFSIHKSSLSNSSSSLQRGRKSYNSVSSINNPSASSSSSLSPSPVSTPNNPSVFTFPRTSNLSKMVTAASLVKRAQPLILGKEKLAFFTNRNNSEIPNLKKKVEKNIIHPLDPGERDPLSILLDEFLIFDYFDVFFFFFFFEVHHYY
jgi:hypothetical protein